MIFKVNILEPWESGTQSSVDATLVKKDSESFLIFLKDPVKVKKQNAQFFICELKDKKTEIAFVNKMNGVYPINMVFDKNINTKDSRLPPLNVYRDNFLLGEIVINNST